jgi:hypothetical protein
MVSMPKIYRGLWMSLAVSHRREAVSQGHEAVTERSPGGFSSWEYKEENGACPLWILKIKSVQIRTEEYRGIEDEIKRIHSDLKR